MLAVPQIQDALKPESNSSFGDDKWMWYIALALPITAVTLVSYAAWEYLYKRKQLKMLFRAGDKGHDVEMQSASGADGTETELEEYQGLPP